MTLNYMILLHKLSLSYKKRGGVGDGYILLLSMPPPKSMTKANSLNNHAGLAVIKILTTKSMTKIMTDFLTAHQERRFNPRQG